MPNSQPLDFYQYCRQKFLEKFDYCGSSAQAFLCLFENYQLGNTVIIKHQLKENKYQAMIKEEIFCYLAKKIVRNFISKKTKKVMKYYAEAIILIKIFNLEQEAEILRENLVKKCIKGIRSNTLIREIIIFIRDNNFEKEKIISEVISSLEFKEKKFEASEIKKFFKLPTCPISRNYQLDRVVNNILCRQRY